MLLSFRFISPAFFSLFSWLLVTSQSIHPLFTAVKSNDIKQVKSLLDDGNVDVNDS
jgi:hypothetical protein